MKKGIYIVLILIILAGGAFFFINQEKHDETGGEDEELPVLFSVPSFELSDYDGNTRTNEEFLGRVAVINSWATWCPFCVDELPDFVDLQNEFGEDIVVVAVNRRESKETAQEFTDEISASDGIVYLLDPRDSFYRGMGGFAMPETIFADASGSVRIHKRGFMDIDEMRENVEKILGISESI